MARHNNAVTFGSAFNITAAAPIDSRMVVDAVEDLYLEETWPSDKAPIYKGMPVVVSETSSLYVLADPENFTSETAWVKVGGSTATAVTELENKIKDLEERLASLETRQDEDDTLHELGGDDFSVGGLTMTDEDEG